MNMQQGSSLSGDSVALSNGYARRVMYPVWAIKVVARLVPRHEHMQTVGNKAAKLVLAAGAPMPVVGPPLVSNGDVSNELDQRF